MTRAVTIVGAACGVGVCAALLVWAGAGGRFSALAQHRNLGKAFYENPTTQAEAVVEFKKALDLAAEFRSREAKLRIGAAARGKDSGRRGATQGRAAARSEAAAHLV